MIDDHRLQADFRGCVLASYLVGQRVRFFAGESEIRGVVTAATAHADSGWAATATIRIAAPVPQYSPGMFDQGIGRFRGQKFLSRACDDLAGAAAILEMLHRLAGQATKAPIAVLLTRAEEEGFVGAIAAARDKKLLRRDDRIIAIEISARQSYARQGEGAVIRIGDKTSIFHSGLTYFLVQQAEALKKTDKTFQYQRALMPGGTCEATVYDVYGLAATSICIPLANYHNMDQDQKKIAPEIVDVRDWQNMVKLFLAIAKNAHEYQPGHKFLRSRLEKRFVSLKGHLANH
jgi:endoglucanase